MKDILLLKSYQFWLLPQSVSTFVLFSIELSLAFLLGYGLLALGTDGGSWILGGIAAGAIAFPIYRRRGHAKAQPNRNARKVGQMLVGLNIGLAMEFSALRLLAPQLPIFAILIGFLLLSSLAIGYFYSRLEKTRLLTGLLASVPGNIGVLASIAADYGGNVSLVSLVQLIRFTAVILIVPLIAHVSQSHDLHAIFNTLTQALSQPDFINLGLLALLLAITGFTVHWGQKLNVPVAALLCSILVGIVFNGVLAIAPHFSVHLPLELPFPDRFNLLLNLTVPAALSLPLCFKLPPLLNLIGQILLGITIGEYWGMNPRFSQRTLACATLPVGLTLGVACISATIAKFLTPWDWLTCFLVTSPGGSPEMILIALTLNHQVEVVTTGHLVRLLAINFSLPILISFATAWERNHTKEKSDISKVLLQHSLF